MLFTASATPISIELYRFVKRYTVTNLIKTKGLTTVWQSGESTRDISFPFNYSKAKDISYSAVTSSNDGGVTPYFQMYEFNGKLRIIPFLNGNTYTIKNNLTAKIIFNYKEI